ncbi:V-set and transmembrane domain-containing protein 1 [Nothobranchius furzeri]|uniref:Chromosome 3 SCAF14707, whole genome shotgun sequence, Uncharacterized protein n=2 Tax=Nothobranchius furzeri TaxID=105023 RepID=A0A1A8AP51_NOTFU|nr:T-cell immunoreceptor with Ig and ITIM domains-like [Nothobranchius furzeri]
MSAVWMKIATILCLCCSELTDARVMWKEAGESITISCTSDSQLQMMYLMKGLNRDEQIFFTERTKQKHNIKDTMKVRVQAHIVFPKVEVLIKNLTRNDTGPYWCLYKTMSSSEYTDSLLLVVTEKQQERTAAVCESSSVNVVVLAVVAFSVVLLAIMLFLVLWITKKNTRASFRPEKTSSRPKNNDVYEDMRGTIRR